MSIKSFAIRHGLVHSTFYRWCKTFSQQAGKDVFDKPVMEWDSGTGFSQIDIASDSFGESTSPPVAIIRLLFRSV